MADASNPAVEYWKGLSNHYAQDAKRHAKRVEVERGFTRQWMVLAVLFAGLGIVGISCGDIRHRAAARALISQCHL